MSTPALVIILTVHPAPPVRERLTIEIESDYCEPFIADLKALIPARDRYWQEERRRWWVAPAHLATLRELARAHFARPWLHDGPRRQDLLTGVWHEQLSLFG